MDKLSLTEMTLEQLQHQYRRVQVHRTMSDLHEKLSEASQVFDQIQEGSPLNRRARISEAAQVQRAVNVQDHGEEILAFLAVCKSLSELTRALYTINDADDKAAVQRLYKSVEVLAKLVNKAPEPELSEEAKQLSLDFDGEVE